MLQEQRKVAKIIAELTMFFLLLGADEISSSVKKRGNEGTITFCSNYRRGCEEKIQNMYKCLNQQRNDGIEDIYWELAGSGASGDTSQLMLVGMMIDKAEMELEDGFVKLTMHKKLER